jgi:hypothetical protein
VLGSLRAIIVPNYILLINNLLFEPQYNGPLPDFFNRFLISMCLWFKGYCMKNKLSKVCWSLVMLLCGCTETTEVVRIAAPENQKVQDVPVGQSVGVRDADSSQCAAGGMVYIVYIDENLNSNLDAEDSVVKEYPICNGSNGNNGSNGSNGQNGNGVAFTVVEASTQVCGNGGFTILMATDVGNTGVYSVEADNQQSMTICNGANAAPTEYTAVDTILACGNNVAYKEVLLRLQNGQVLGSVSNDTGGSMTRLSFLSDGTFMNTDDSGCVFTLSTSSDGKTRSISWGGQVQKSWSMP